jgi:shikimate kinase
MQKVVLLGYMGSGKSILSEKLAKKINVKGFELDELIEKKAKMTIESLFSKKGELYFRKLEHEILKEIVTIDDSFVLSTGGGTPCYFNNMELIKNSGCIVVYLKASIETLYKRLNQQKNNRPLLLNLEGDDLKEFIAKHLFERSFYYNQANFIVNVDDKIPETIIEEIEKLL